MTRSAQLEAGRWAVRPRELDERSLGPTLRRVGRACGLVATTARTVVEARFEAEISVDAHARRANRCARRLLGIHGVHVRATGPLPLAPAVIVANHVSYLDPLVFSSLVPCISIAKVETQEWPLIGRSMRALGVVFVRRDDPYSGACALWQVWRALRAGATVLNFPEGTTGNGGNVARFRRGVFGLALLAGVSIVPAHVSYDDERIHWFGGQTFVPHYWRMACTEHVGARVRFGEPIAPRRSENGDALAERARSLVVALGLRERAASEDRTTCSQCLQDE